MMAKIAISTTRKISGAKRARMAEGVVAEAAPRLGGFHLTHCQTPLRPPHADRPA